MIFGPSSGVGSNRRAIRVFISSTFRDMHAERDELVKLVFPQVRKLCERRGVAWAEVDLRWGVTDEQKSEGKVLEICLAEIRNCRPFFLGILGQRYGWVPESIPPELAEGQRWLVERDGRSVTELEILHGVLNDPEMAGHAFFYLRDPTYIDRLPRTANRADFTCESPASAEKLARLVDSIRASGFPLRENYRDPRALADLVLADLVAMVDRLFPPGSEPDGLDREAIEHESFARSRAQVYVARPSDYETLDAHARGDGEGIGEGEALVVLGESGSGKSALLANWALRHHESRPEVVLLMHFVGATPESTDGAAMLRRIVGELKRRCGLPRAIPDRPDQLQAEFADWLAAAAEKAPVLLVIDALNQLEDRDGALDLSWLPHRLPANVRLVVSTLPGRSLDELIQRRWASHYVEPLRPDEREALIVDYLAQYSKSLSPQRIRTIVASEATASPLYLRALLEELRLFGVHERLDERLAHYLATTTLEDLYSRILERYEADYEQDRPGLVREAMSLLWASRGGLSESDLLDLLGRRGVPLPRAQWAPLALAAESALVNRSGLLGFSHEYIREAARQKYLPRDRDRRRAHRRLADHFERRELGRRRLRGRRVIPDVVFLLLYAAIVAWLLTLLNASIEGVQDKSTIQLSFLIPPATMILVVSAAVALWMHWGLARFLKTLRGRVEGGFDRLRLKRRPDSDSEGSGSEGLTARGVEELPWQLARAREWWRLYDLLRNLPFFHKAWETNPFQVKTYWREVESGTRGAVGRRIFRTRELETIFRDLFGGRPIDAYRLVVAVPAAYRGYNAAVAQLLAESGNYQEAAVLIDRLVRHDERRDETARLTDALVLQADGFRARNSTVVAMAAYRRAERLSRASEDRRSLSRCLEGQAAMFLERKALDDALRYAQEAESLGRDCGDATVLARALLTRAKVTRARGEPAVARGALADAERLLRSIGGRVEMVRVLDEQQRVLTDLGEIDAAREVALRAELLRNALGDSDATPSPDDLDARLAVLRRDEQANLRSGQPVLLAQALVEQAHHWALLRNFPIAAKPLARRAARLARRERLDDLLTEFQPVLEATAPTEEELSRDAVGRARGAVFLPLTAMLTFGFLAYLGLSHAVSLAQVGVTAERSSYFLERVQSLGLEFWSSLIIGVSLLLVTARNGHALLAAPYLIMTPQGLALRHWRLESESVTIKLLVALLLPFHQVKHAAVAWSEFRGCRIEKSLIVFPNLLIIEIPGADIRVGRIFSMSPEYLRKEVHKYFSEIKPANPELTPNPFHAKQPEAAPVSRLAVASLTFAILSYPFCLFLFGPLAVYLGHRARRAIRDSEGRLGGERAVRWGLILGYMNVIGLVVSLIAIFVAILMR